MSKLEEHIKTAKLDQLNKRLNRENSGWSPAFASAPHAADTQEQQTKEEENVKAIEDCFKSDFKGGTKYGMHQGSADGVVNFWQRVNITPEDLPKIEKSLNAVSKSVLNFFQNEVFSANKRGTYSDKNDCWKKNEDKLLGYLKENCPDFEVLQNNIIELGKAPEDDRRHAAAEHRLIGPVFEHEIFPGIIETVGRITCNKLYEQEQEAAKRRNAFGNAARNSWSRN